MRQDTKVLLSRLDERNFNYHDFESPSAEVDVWPIFEALLLDERVVGKRVSSAAQSSATQPTPGRAPEPQAQPREVSAASDPVQPGMFGGYGAAGKSESGGESVRDMLGRLASNAG